MTERKRREKQTIVPPDGTFSSRLEQIRVEWKWSVSKLAKFLGYSQGTVQQWRTGSMPPVNTIKDLATKLSIRFEYLAFGDLPIRENREPGMPPPPIIDEKPLEKRVLDEIKGLREDMRSAMDEILAQVKKNR